MIAMQNVKFVSVTPPAAIVDNGAYTTAEIDTRGWDYLTYVIYLGATDIAVAALKVTQSDAAGSGHADVTGADFSVLPATLPSATDDNGFFLVHINLAGKKRYFDLTATAGDGAAGTFLTAFAVLSRGKQMPDSATDQGAVQALTVN